MIYDIIPVNDVLPHEESSPCPCDPTVEDIEGTEHQMVIHNAFDGREGMELSNEVLKPKSEN